MSPVINLKGKRGRRQPLYACTHVCMQGSVLRPRKIEKLTFWESLTFFSLLAVLLLSFWVRCHHLVAEVASRGLSRPDFSRVHVVKVRKLPQATSDYRNTHPSEKGGRMRCATT